VRYCKNCVYPAATVNIEFSEEGICSACEFSREYYSLTDEFWRLRELKFREILEQRLESNQSNYDCIIPVSGGKDSYYQTHIVTKKYGLKPLLVTYHGNNYLPVGDLNRDRMRQVFDGDHLVFGPSVEVLKKLNKLGFEKIGDMNWHAHCGIMTYPIIAAVQNKIPLIFWGETAWDISGMYSIHDTVEFSAQMRHEHQIRGYEWYDIIQDNKYGITEKDLIWAKYPSDEEILESKVRGLYIGNYFKWEPYQQTEIVKSQYLWQESPLDFDRTYRKISNLDDRYENGIHDYLKFIKFGYGRASDHASKDIRAGLITRDEGIDLVKKYDAAIPSDLYHWLEYVNYDEKKFWEIVDSFRSPYVWKISGNNWVKRNIWGGWSEYGNLSLGKDKLKILGFEIL
jgi:N-acetyl sugar amidotransferase